MAAPDHLYFTEDDEANALIATDPFALLVGFALDQQITVQQAFAGPLRIKQRVGTLDPARLARSNLEPIFKQKPAVHRFPGSMARRVQDLASYVMQEYGGDASRIWTDARDGAELTASLLPVIWDRSVGEHGRLLAHLAEAQEIATDRHTLADVDSPQALLDYQAAKRAYKAEQRAKAAR